MGIFDFSSTVPDASGGGWDATVTQDPLEKARTTAASIRQAFGIGADNGQGGKDYSKPDPDIAKQGAGIGKAISGIFGGGGSSGGGTVQQQTPQRPPTSPFSAAEAGAAAQRMGSPFGPASAGAPGQHTGAGGHVYAFGTPTQKGTGDPEKRQNNPQIYAT